MTRLSTIGDADVLPQVHRIARDVVGPAAADVDAESRFPTESLEALRQCRLMAASLPLSDGGLGWDLPRLARSTELLAQACSSTGLIWAMHHSQLLCLARHSPPSEPWRDIRHAIAESGCLVASAASELTVGASFLEGKGRLEQSHDGSRLQVRKPAGRVSYGEEADAFLVSARPATADMGDCETTRAVFAWGTETTVVPRGTWAALGMRGTVTRPVELSADVPRAQLLPEPFSVILNQTMIPVAHTLWAACWIGIAQGAVATALDHARRDAAGRPTVALAIGDAAAQLDTARALVERGATSFEAFVPAAASRVDTLAMTARYNRLKVQVATLTSSTVIGALTAIGLQGFLEDSEFSIARRLRDVLSAPVMVNNHRLRDINAEMQPVLRGRETLFPHGDPTLPRAR